jgi:hypothetical protein
VHHPSIHPSIHSTNHLFIHPSIHPSIPPSWYTGKQPTGFILTPGRLLSSEPQVPTLLCQRTCIISTYLPTHLLTNQAMITTCLLPLQVHPIFSLALTSFSLSLSLLWLCLLQLSCSSTFAAAAAAAESSSSQSSVSSFLKSIFPTSNKVSISCAC